MQEIEASIGEDNSFTSSSPGALKAQQMPQIDVRAHMITILDERLMCLANRPLALW
jgi:hypothetical protein